ncbi:5,10-methylenetetrahydrofolate dehydrogenase (NADP+) / methenyltetrahydrofolate cyclohydrolase [Magnetococcus marinus MC-1]|uniref:Bifunctional protein FolD n=1 Tax=Magnetococcus marinus (strain ATCC BAA-1437 / JCM 17883 / MC-1) TaxID=156889 RepID=FOLD_MAGMM|nr:bifunctional methylenetetrahydrofolate dehydrogenase/methenyltetrahydrofolate cyclohydrolase FolD [Magnetococcus marinus]A0LE04.1 RecName: Full=Bifunctional protein FolD; Includes: RecName: Full=Methylenetetrahydrofolate dehydrogenase; Includes: RecName: Full=Methenyltetrahydrofolate cyclohydrolase [Magnetococcus marinus MC-1]ABK46197.1 5,10-methylenetetrahydrofolate dehydrogenase (NADP+) / methenyltetrahydrofolate cyclohydrolase [Magnetococcus marinus MC-1]
MAHVIDGKAIAQSVREELRMEVERLKLNHQLTPGLAVVLVGADPASQVYVRNKKRACETAGIASFSHELAATTSQAELLALIEQLNQDDAVHGILVQLPLPKHIDEQKVLEAISPSKDADGFHPYNVGRLVTGDPTFQPCTPWGVMEMLKVSGVDPKGKHAVVIGRSNIVGKPVALMLLAAHATVTICHSRTPDLAETVKRADIVVAAVGRANMVPGSWIKKGAVVIDVGINRGEDGKLCGDVDYASCFEHASAITPVPGGVGPMTIAMLLKNTVEGAKRAHNIA